MAKFFSRVPVLVLFFVFIFLSCSKISNAQTIAPIKILLVPGHNNEVWGAQYGNLKEAAMTLAMANRIYDILKKDKRFEVHITRDKDGYTKEFADYFSNHQADIIAFEKSGKQEMQNNIISGQFIQKKNAPHLTVSSDVAIRLYGFNKWADENKMDAMIHIHFNDYPRANKWTMGKYKGFAIYMPDPQFPNGKESDQLATDIFTQLHKKYITSTYPPERGGLIPDQKLIALGSNDTLDASVRSVLIEYGYIYRFGSLSTRQNAYANMSNLTVTGIKNYFFGK